MQILILECHLYRGGGKKPLASQHIFQEGAATECLKTSFYLLRFFLTCEETGVTRRKSTHRDNPTTNRVRTKGFFHKHTFTTVTGATPQPCLRVWELHASAQSVKPSLQKHRFRGMRLRPRGVITLRSVLLYAFFNNRMTEACGGILRSGGQNQQRQWGGSSVIPFITSAFIRNNCLRYK